MTTQAAPDQDLIWRQKVTPAVPPPGCSCVFNVDLLNVRMPARATVGNHALACNVPLQQTPAELYALVFVDGTQQDVGGLTACCYFSADGGITARTLGPGGNLAAGDLLYWNGSIAGFNLATSDTITLDYFYVT
jgi:hypothetical protein